MKEVEIRVYDCDELVFGGILTETSNGIQIQHINEDINNVAGVIKNLIKNGNVITRKVGTLSYHIKDDEWYDKPILREYTIKVDTIDKLLEELAGMYDVYILK